MTLNMQISGSLDTNFRQKKAPILFSIET